MKKASICVLKATDCVCFPLLLWESCAWHNKAQTDLGTLRFVIAIIQCFSQVQLCAHNGIKQSQVKNVVLGTPQGQLLRGVGFFHFTCIVHAYIYLYTYECLSSFPCLSINTEKNSIPAMLSMQEGMRTQERVLPHVSSCCVELDIYLPVSIQAA